MRGPSHSRQSPPSENKGLSTPQSVTLDLGGEIEGMQGRQLRMRILKLEPGGVIGMHSHTDRPAVAYLLDGTLTEHRDGTAPKEHAKGEMLAVGKDVSHWEQNKGQGPVVLVVGDFLKP
jgi:quercetin dioxygenase-like cupin family protein